MNDKEKYELLKKIISKEDPIGLIDFEIAESLDEYDPELKEIFKREISVLDSKELGQWIYQVFVEFFNEELAGGKEKYNRIANEFLLAMNNHNKK